MVRTTSSLLILSANTPSFIVCSKISDSITQCLQDLFHNMALPDNFSLTMDLHSPQNPFPKFLSTQGIDHITSSSLFPKSNGFIECQIKTIKYSLATTRASGISINHLLNILRSTPIGPNLLSLPEILHNWTDYRPRQPSTPVDLDQIRDCLLTKESQ